MTYDDYNKSQILCIAYKPTNYQFTSIFYRDLPGCIFTGNIDCICDCFIYRYSEFN